MWLHHFADSNTSMRQGAQVHGQFQEVLVAQLQSLQASQVYQ
jgi:hypothetical protein